MKLNLMDVEHFVQRKKIKPVTSSKYHTGSSRNELDKNGLFSEEIFGRLGSRERKTNYGYVDLKLEFIHPEAYRILTSINTDLTKLILGKQNYIFDNNNNLVQDENGNSGIFYFIQNIDNINWDEIKTEKPKHVQFIKNNRDKILINKLILLPAGYRDIQITNTGKQFIQYGEINKTYSTIINQTSMLSSNPELFDEDLVGSLFKSIQRNLITVNLWLKSKMKGKYGMIRGGMLKKSVDYSARLVIVPDNKLDMGYMGLPWQVCMKLFEPFFIHYTLKKDRDNMLKAVIQKFLGLEEDIDINDIKKFVKKVNEIPRDIDNMTVNILKETMEKVTEGKVVIYKRDPVENRDSYISNYIKVDDTGFVAKLNSYDLCKNGGDFDGDTVAVFSLLTDESQEQAKQKMNVLHSKGAWRLGGNYDKSAFELTQDAAIAIYTATVQ